MWHTDGMFWLKIRKAAPTTELPFELTTLSAVAILYGDSHQSIYVYNKTNVVIILINAKEKEDRG